MNTATITTETITAFEAATQSMGLPSWWVSGRAVTLYCGSFVCDDEQKYCPVLVDGTPKLMCLHIEHDSDGTRHSYFFVDEVPGGMWGQEIFQSDYLSIATHMGYSEPF